MPRPTGLPPSSARPTARSRPASAASPASRRSASGHRDLRMVERDSFVEVYRQRTYQLAAVGGAAGMAILLAWSSQVGTAFPQGGLFLDVDALTLVSLALAAGLFVITLPLHWYAWRRTRVVGPAS